MAAKLSSKGEGTVPKKRKAGKRRGPSRFAKLRGTATIRMTTEQIMAMTRGKP